MTDTPLANLSYILDLSKQRIFQRGDGTVSDELLELLELHVPAMVRVIRDLEDQVEEMHAAEVVHSSELRRLRQVEKMIRSLNIQSADQFVSFDTENGIATAEFPVIDFDKIESLNHTLNRLRENLS